MQIISNNIQYSSNPLQDLPVEIAAQILQYLSKQEKIILMGVNKSIRALVAAWLSQEEKLWLNAHYRQLDGQLYKAKLENNLARIRAKKLELYHKFKSGSKKVGKVTVIATSPITLPCLVILTMVGFPTTITLSIATCMPIHKNETCLTIISLPTALPLMGIIKVIDVIKSVKDNGL